MGQVLGGDLRRFLGSMESTELCGLLRDLMKRSNVTQSQQEEIEDIWGQEGERERGGGGGSPWC